MTEWHVRYGGPGVMIYWHVERKSACIYSQLKTCSASEVAAMIEGLLRHLTSAEIDRNYTDTHGASIMWTPQPSRRLRKRRPSQPHSRLLYGVNGPQSGGSSEA
jgi:Tn3 transposase DDE domain-containing protein